MKYDLFVVFLCATAAERAKGKCVQNTWIDLIDLMFMLRLFMEAAPTVLSAPATSGDDEFLF